MLPSKVFEYGCLGKPIIAGVDGYASKFLKEEMIGCFIFKPCDISSLKNVFSKIVICTKKRKVFLRGSMFYTLVILAQGRLFTELFLIFL